ncbi:alpha-ketoglutarate dehydrogenase [Polynucleobacter asymbioticus]|uniref:Pyruvate dehydrogenase E1 component n=1 Tax=Polynucleobacter asymbioticus TaxID=576611 RepID=A0AAC9IYI6_9BURK|nr:alpha-ketoglutarate dehydrogenase [Polynucleobacter asymbioticus]APB99435.1 pyruvate dehydrogenase (acetyl-transferring), homodimeric type [Polynucleobacter asymbioticus]APC01742.1 pyruvate dehydrogenase (acetyl-transferring), homodimeric type [Polynucleobacter asymbioticus]
MNAPDIKKYFNPEQLDTDPTETTEWTEAFQDLLANSDSERAKFILDNLVKLANKNQINWVPDLVTPYINSIPVDEQPAFPGDLATEEKLASLMRWNALAMVAKANEAYGELGGHIASYASAADLFEVGFNHFFRARTESGDVKDRGDLVFFQPHSAPGVYARAYLEGRLTENDLAHYRREITAPDSDARGLSSYPHPWLMPDFWQFPTGSMGIGPISSIYHARFMRYLTDRKLLDCTTRKVWGVFGDGEMDEPESMSALTLASREKLDNLVWVVNCNLQRLDGPVRGNGRIIDELEKLFRGSGWNVIKLVWGSDWDGLFARDTTGALVKAFAQTVDGQMQTFAAKDGSFNRKNFFGQNEELARLAQGMTDEQIDRLKRGGHDLVKIYAAYHAAANHVGQPTVILAHTKKGYGMGNAGQGKMTTHSQKKLDDEALIEYRNRFNLPLTDEQATSLTFFRPDEDSEELQYLKQQRNQLGGQLPKRYSDCEKLNVPDIESYTAFALKADDKEMSTTMAFVRMLGNLLKDKALGPRVVPIVADEARTFGMANLFKQVGIYSSVGQRYEPEDIGSVLSYREALDGQILEEGISEAGAIASWTAAATSYSVHGIAMLPFYIYYSMFGFQRIGDAIWAAADQRARGFLLGATSGRTTLGGEGLQHQDGSSQLVAATIPNCKAYDPAFAGELAVIVDQGMRDMLVEQKDLFYYITLMNENYAQPDLPADAAEGVIRGAYQFKTLIAEKSAKETWVTLLGSGAIMTEVLKSADSLVKQGINVDIYSVTSWSELSRDGKSKEQAAHSQGAKAEPSYVHQLLMESHGPIIAATDYVHAVPESIRAYIPEGRSYITLGTDGFGRSDTRAALRDYFGVDAESISRVSTQALKK